MRRRVIFLSILSCMMMVGSGQAQWLSVAGTLPEIDVQSVVASAVDSDVIYAGTDRRIYRTLNAGQSWRQIMGLKGTEDRITFLVNDPVQADTVYVGTTKGLRRSLDRGEHWQVFYAGLGGAPAAVYCLTQNAFEPDQLWLGTSKGIVCVDRSGKNKAVLENAPRLKTTAIVFSKEIKGLVMINTDQGIYRSADLGNHWERVAVSRSGGVEEPGDAGSSGSHEQFGVEEISLAPKVYELVFAPMSKSYFAATPSGIMKSDIKGESWNASSGSGLPSKSIRNVVCSSGATYLATDRGVYQYAEQTNTFRDVSQGLGSLDVRGMYYHAGGDFILATTAKGIYKWAYPDVEIVVPGDGKGNLKEISAILSGYDYEPSVREIQKAAIEYAEVHPEKIKAWREAAARKAWMPTLSLNHGVDTNNNVDVDRGGTADPDRFIQGPSDTSSDWSATVSWDLGELVWNDDQTSIDVRSKLMVELRNDILQEVTHLYYERRRAQVELKLSPARDLPILLDKELKLQELTADIDALTGGYLSKRLAETPMIRDESRS